MPRALPRHTSTLAAHVLGGGALIAGMILAAHTAPAAHRLAIAEARLVSTVGRALETRFARPELPTDARIDGIVILGGSPHRVTAALRLAEQFPSARVILSGPGPIEVALAEAGFGNSERFAIDPRATTTYENAAFSKDLAAPRPGQCWAVVTSAVHMPRAMGAFEAVGFPVLPWPVDDTPHLPKQRSGAVWHEVLGLAGYWAFGRSSDLWPTDQTAKGTTLGGCTTDH